MSGTIRTFDKKMQADIYLRMKTTAENIALSAGATAEVIINPGSPVTYNDIALTERMLPSLQRTAGKSNTMNVNPVTMGEDFSFFQEKTPGLFFFLGGMTPGTDPKKAPIHHTPDFMIDEAGFGTGVKAMVNLTVDYMFGEKMDIKKN
jgi:metal-dependent amidase/aminoacylase/carboxypeptidase family protein